MIALLDVNVLLALFWPRHIFYRCARDWFAAHRKDGWATCPITEAGFARLYSQPAVTGLDVRIEEAIQTLQTNCMDLNHTFWPHSEPVSALTPAIRTRLVGAKQLTDAILLDLAIRKGGRLATFDRRAANLLTRDSVHHAAIEIIPTE